MSHLIVVGAAAGLAGVVARDAGLVATALPPVERLLRALGHTSTVQHQEAVLERRQDGIKLYVHILRT